MYQKRVSLTQQIDFDRLAVPASNSLQELQQLEYINNWTKFELSLEEGPEALSFHFSQVLCVLRYHPELWMTYATTLLQLSQFGDARQVYKEAVSVVPTSLVLRLGYAELEERCGDTEACIRVLREAFHDLQCPLSFSVWQKAVRAASGVDAARQCFSETFSIRRAADATSLVYWFYGVHAQLELDANAEPRVALLVLDHARRGHPQTMHDLDFLRLLIRTLTALGDLDQLRWVYQSILQSTEEMTTASSVASGDANKFAYLTNQQKLEFHEDYLAMELTAGSISISVLTELRLQSETLRHLVERDAQAARISTGSSTQGPASATAYRTVASVCAAAAACAGGVFDASVRLYERFALTAAQAMLPAGDALHLQRCFLSELIQKQLKNEKLSVSQEELKKRMSRGARDISILAIKLEAPDSVRELLLKLPPVAGLAISTDAFVERLRRVILPPRPVAVEEQTDEHLQQEEIVEDVFRARQRQKLEHLVY